MIEERGKSVSKKWFGFIIGVILLTDLAVALNIPYLRQLMGFIFLTVLPGSLLLFLMKLNKLATAERIVMVIGLSIAFLLFFGLLLNEICLSFGYMEPLATNVLLISLNLVFITLLIIAYITNREAFSSTFFHVELNQEGKLLLILFSILPLMSSLGMYFLNTFDNNSILLIFLLGLVPLSIILINMLKNKISSDTYPLAIILLAVSVMVPCWLRSEHIMGSDVHYEYYMFYKTLSNGHWTKVEGSVLDACLGISLLPAVYQSLVHIGRMEYLFKGIYVIICAFTPVCVYIISKKYLPESYAFLGALFFIFQPTFLTTAGSTRTNLGIFFFALSVMALFSLTGIDGVKQRGLFVIFMASTLLSHYSTTYIFLFMLISVYLIGLPLRKYQQFKSITIVSISLFFSMIFLWYSQITESPFNSVIWFIEYTFKELPKFFVEESRSYEMNLLTGGGFRESYLSAIHYVLIYVTFAFTGVGVLGTMIKRKDMLFIAWPRKSESGFLQTKFEMDYFFTAVASIGIQMATLVLPYVSEGYDITRLYSQTLVLLSVFFIIGGIVLSKYFFKLNPRWLILLLLILYAAFTTGATYEVAGVHKQAYLSSEAVTYSFENIDDQESSAAKWLKERIGSKSQIYTADAYGSQALISQGKFSPSLIDRYSFYYRRQIKGCLYLSYNNANGKFMSTGWVSELCDISDYSDTFISKNMIYNNGGGVVYK